MTSTETARADYIAGLRAIADLLERDADLPLPFERKFSWNVWPHETGDVKAEVARIRRLLPGKFDKNEPNSTYGTHYFTLTGELHGFALEIATYRDQVCERVVTGTREVVETVPAPDAPMVEVVKTVEDFEWVCSPILAEATA